MIPDDPPAWLAALLAALSLLVAAAGAWGVCVLLWDEDDRTARDLRRRLRRRD